MSVVSVGRAISEGTTPADLEAIAQWHDARLAEVANLRSNDKKRSAGSIPRHRRLAAALRQTAQELHAATVNQAA